MNDVVEGTFWGVGGSSSRGITIFCVPHAHKITGGSQ